MNIYFGNILQTLSQKKLLFNRKRLKISIYNKVKVEIKFMIY